MAAPARNKVEVIQSVSVSLGWGSTTLLDSAWAAAKKVSFYVVNKANYQIEMTLSSGTFQKKLSLEARAKAIRLEMLIGDRLTIWPTKGKKGLAYWNITELDNETLQIDCDAEGIYVPEKRVL